MQPHNENIDPALAQYQSVLDAIPYAHYLGLRVIEKQTMNKPIFHLPFQEKLIGNWALPAIHGGVICGMMEISALVQVIVTQHQSHFPKIIDFSVDYLRSAQTLDCMSVCHTIRQGKRVVAVKIDCWQPESEKLVATSRAHLLLDINNQAHTSNKSI